MATRSRCGQVSLGVLLAGSTWVNRNTLVIELLKIREFYQLDLRLLDLKPLALLIQTSQYCGAVNGRGRSWATDHLLPSSRQVFRAALDEVSRRCGGFVVHPAESSSCELQGGLGPLGLDLFKVLLKVIRSCLELLELLDPIFWVTGVASRTGRCSC